MRWVKSWGDGRITHLRPIVGRNDIIAWWEQATKGINLDQKVICYDDVAR